MRITNFVVALCVGVVLCGCKSGTGTGKEKSQSSSATSVTAKRQNATFVCDAVPGHKLELRKDGTFSLGEQGHTMSGTYTVEGDTLTLNTSGGAPVVISHFAADGFMDPHNSHWTRQKH